MTVQQTGYPTIKFNAQFNSEPFKSPVLVVLLVNGKLKSWE